MIIWLTSYPKSGNTWVRIFLSSLLYSKDSEIDLEVLKNIRTFPKTKDFIGLCDDLQDRDQIIKNWRLNKSKELTKKRRPDLWERYKSKGN